MFGKHSGSNRVIGGSNRSQNATKLGSAGPIDRVIRLGRLGDRSRKTGQQFDQFNSSKQRQNALLACWSSSTCRSTINLQKHQTAPPAQFQLGIDDIFVSRSIRSKPSIVPCRPTFIQLKRTPRSKKNRISSTKNLSSSSPHQFVFNNKLNKQDLDWMDTKTR